MDNTNLFSGFCLEIISVWEYILYGDELMSNHSYYEYLKINGEMLFTMVLLPEKGKKFPTIVCRSPYVNSTVNEPEETTLQNCLNSFCN